MAKNYYLILGVGSDASEEKIKSAYRQQVKDLHPDIAGGNHEPFLNVQEAYAVLSDPVRRKAYDRSIRPERSQSPAQTTRVEEVTPRHSRVEEVSSSAKPGQVEEASLRRSFHTFTPSFDEMFERLWSNFSGLDHPKAERLESLTVEIPLTPVQAFRGGHVRVMVPVRAACPICRGRGGVGMFECLRCQGEGYIEGEAPVAVAYPAGISDNDVVQVGLDQLGITNLYLTVRFRVSETI